MIPKWTSGALSHGKNAWAAKFLKSGFSFDEQLDLAFALGFPHLKLVAMDHPDDADPLASYPARWKGAAPVLFPKKVMICWLKDSLTGGDFRRTGKAPWAKKLSWKLDDEERLRMSSAAAQLANYTMYMLEALESPELVLESSLQQLRNDWEENPSWVDLAGTGISRGMAALLMRVPEKLQKTYRDELADFARQVPREYDYSRFHKAVDQTLGRPGDGVYMFWHRVLRGEAQPKEIIDTLRGFDFSQGWLPNAREAFFGGDPVLDMMRQRWKEMHAGAREELIEQFGWIRSEKVVELFADMLSSPKDKAAILQWFADRADYARPVLADLEKKKGALAGAAKSALQHLDKNGKPSPKKKAAKKKKTTRKRA